MKNNDLISRAEAIDIIRSMTISLGGKEIFHPEAKKSVVGALDEIAAIDAEPVRHGEWLKDGSIGAIGNYCSLCDMRVKPDANYNYCPNCGAKMDAEVEHGT